MKRRKRHSFFVCQNLPVRFLFALLLIFSTIGGEVFAQIDKRVTIKVKNVPIQTVLDQLQKSSQMNFMYEEKTISGKPNVTLEHENALLTVILNDLTAQTALRYEVKESIILLFPSEKPQSQPKASLINQSGKVTDEQGEELIGVNILIEGTTTGVITDFDGRYSIEANPGDVLLFSYIGMDNAFVKVRSDKRTVDVQMKTHQTALGEVVVTGYQTLSKERATGSYSVISEKDTKGKLETNIFSRIEGMVAGMNKVTYGGGQTIIRGVATYLGAISPLYVVDGVPYEGDISSINPSDIQNITVLKDATAASIYGARSANGVIVITTKRGQVGATKVAYSGSIKFIPKPDFDYLNMTNSSELIDLQIEGFNHHHDEYKDLNRRVALNPVIDILYQHELGKIDDLEKALLPYRNSNNRQQIEKEFMRTGIIHQHNLSVSGGTELNQYMASINYMKWNGNQKEMDNDRIGFNFKNNTTLYKWLLADIGVSGSFSKSENKNSSTNFLSLTQSYPSYYMLRDADGTPLPWQRGKSEYELERLRSIGLMDETYSPINEKGTVHSRSNENYYRIHAGLLFKITKGLNLDLKYQTEGNYGKSSTVSSEKSWNVKNMINNAAKYNTEEKELTLNVPLGGQFNESRWDKYSYTFRAQLNFERSFGIHEINAIAGAERRLVKGTSTQVHYMGYDEDNLTFTPYDPFLLRNLSGTEALNSSFNWFTEEHNSQSDYEDRFVSFYGNASYTYNDKYSITGSIRIDKTNLYATDSKAQNRPLWSVGGSWHLAEEKFMRHLDWIDLLKLRATYGIGGNIPKNVGPYMNVRGGNYNSWVGATESYISSPPNPLLKWEKTATTNVGVDFSLFNYRLGGSLNIYNKKTTDILGYRNTDATLGWSSLLINYGEMSNKGIEVELQTVNIQNRRFNWQTNFTFSYNKNELTNLQGTEESIFNYLANNVAAIGYPLNSLFSYRYSGLDPKTGNPFVYNKKGDKVSKVESIEDLVYSGTRTPKYTASLKNSFSYKNFDLSFMLVYYGGHVMRDVVADYLSYPPFYNTNRKTLVHWKKTGDESRRDMAPSININKNDLHSLLWYSADIHVKKADYIKLRDVSLSYNVPKSWLNKYNIGALTITCQINNLWWWAKNGDIDPEAYSVVRYGLGDLTLPNPVTYTLGLSMYF